MDIIPNEILDSILDYLGRRSLVSCLLVNHLWNTIARYLLHSVRLEFGFHPVNHFPVKDIISINNDYTFYTIPNDKVNSGIGTLVKCLPKTVCAHGISGDYVIYIPTQDTFHKSIYTVLTKPAPTKWVMNLKSVMGIQQTIPREWSNPKKLYEIKLLEYGIRLHPYTKAVLDDKLYVVYHYQDFIKLISIKIPTGEKVHEILIPCRNYIFQIKLNPDKSKLYLKGHMNSELSVIHINLSDKSYEVFTYPYSYSTLDEQGRLIIHDDNIISIYEKDKVVSRIEYNHHASKLEAHNRTLYVINKYVQAVYYY